MDAMNENLETHGYWVRRPTTRNT